MKKVKLRPWNPAEVIQTGDDAILYLQISLEDYDPSVFDALMQDIAGSKGVSEIADVTLNDADTEQRSVTVTTTSGASVILPVAPDVNLARIRQALLPPVNPETVSHRESIAQTRA